MRRRNIPVEPMSRLAVWSRRLVLFALTVALAALVLVRGEFIETLPGQSILIASFAVAGIGILYSFGAFIVIWRDGNPGLRYAVTALILGLALLAYPGFVVARGYKLPKIADISTDTNDPPRFEVIARIRPRGANPVEYPGQGVAQQQRAAYPNVASLRLDVRPLEAYENALDIVNKRKWRVVDFRAPTAARREGRIEAVALTPVMGFRDDIVIRVRGSGTSTVVDVRSASRYGDRDWGSNARRIRALLDEIDEESTPQTRAR